MTANTRRLDIRLAILVGFSLLGFALVAGNFTYVYAYRQEFVMADALQRQLVRTVEAQAEVAVYARNRDIAEGVVDGLLASPVVQAVRIESHDGFAVSRGGRASEDFAGAHVYPLRAPLGQRGEQIGALRVVRNDDYVARGAARAALLQTGVMLGMVAAAMILLIVVLRILLIAPISRLTRTIATVVPGSSARIAIEPGHANDEIGQLAHNVNSLLDATTQALVEIHQQRNELERLATHDPLTGLPTMRLAEDRLNVACAAADRSASKVALLFVDLDGFKGVNDRYGHAAGDQALRMVATRLREVMRAEDTVARLGGDEFLVILGNLADADASARVAREINLALSMPMFIDGQEVVLGASIGIAVYPDHVGDVKAMRHLADTAMYRVKRTGKGAFAFADGTVDG